VRKDEKIKQPWDGRRRKKEKRIGKKMKDNPVDGRRRSK
jgi:hypothetical protein